MKDIIIKKDKINFIINPQIELLSVIQIMAGENEKEYKDWYENNEFYIKSIKKYFNLFRNHPAIVNYRKYYINNSQIAKCNFDNSKLLYTDDSDDNLNEYLLLLNDFIIKSNYYDFFSSMKDYYNNVLTYNADNIEKLKIVDNLCDYYGKKINVNIVFKMIQGDWGEYLYNNNNDEFVILCGISKMKDYPLFIEYKQIISLCFHECTHPFVNKYLTTDYDMLAETEDLFIKIDENSIARKNYFTYNDYLEDLVVRAITAYIQFKYQYSTEEEYNKELLYMENIGFIYIKDIANILKRNDFYTSMNLVKEYLYSKTMKNYISKT